MRWQLWKSIEMATFCGWSSLSLWHQWLFLLLTNAKVVNSYCSFCVLLTCLCGAVNYSTVKKRENMLGRSISLLMMLSWLMWVSGATFEGLSIGKAWAQMKRLLWGCKETCETFVGVLLYWYWVYNVQQYFSSIPCTSLHAAVACYTPGCTVMWIETVSFGEGYFKVLSVLLITIVIVRHLCYILKFWN